MGDEPEPESVSVPEFNNKDIYLDENRYIELLILFAHDTWHDFYGSKVKEGISQWSHSFEEIPEIFLISPS